MARFNEAQLRDRYEAVAIPEPLRTGELDADQIVNETEDRFMDEVIDSLGLSRRALEHVLSFEHSMLVAPAMHVGEIDKVSDDFVRRLRVTGVQTLASVERSRDDMNFMVVHFAKYSLSSLAVRRIAVYSDEIGKDL